MASTLKKAQEMRESTAALLAGDPALWKDFLRLAARFYAYPFSDQLLIYAQRPDATAVATLEYWNSRMNCRIRPGSVGIALIDEDGPGSPLRYVFDRTAAVPVPGIGRSPVLWALPDFRREELSDHLSKAFALVPGSLSPRGLEGTVLSYAFTRTEQVLDEKAEEMRIAAAGCRALGQDEIECRNLLRRVIVISTVQILCFRLALPDAFSPENLSCITRFDTPSALYVAGRACQEICRPFLSLSGRYLRTHPEASHLFRVKTPQEVAREYQLLKESMHGGETGPAKTPPEEGYGRDQRVQRTARAR